MAVFKKSPSICNYSYRRMKRKKQLKESFWRQCTLRNYELNGAGDFEKPDTERSAEQ